MEELNLAKLKALNAAEESGEGGETVTHNEPEDNKAEEVEAEESGQVAEPAKEEAENTELEGWMQTDEQTSESAVPVAKVAQLRKKFRGKIEERDGEIERLRAENERLKSGGVKPVVTESNLPPAPKRFEFDTDEQYDTALAKWVDERSLANYQRLSQSSSQQQKAEQSKTQLNKAVDAHYDRAATLVETQGISAEVYQAADTNFRATIDSVYPGMGDTIADQLIASLGEGSEKVGFFIGRNAAAQAELKSRLMSDPSGIQAAIYLGELKKEKALPVKRISSAPAPATPVKGDANSSGTLKRLKDAYEKAGDDLSKRLQIRREAKSAGINPDNW